MKSLQFLARGSEREAEYSLRAETAEMVRAELRDSTFQKDVEKFIRALGMVVPNTRGLFNRLDSVDQSDEDALAIADLVSKLKARLMLSDSPLVSYLLAEIDEALGEEASENFIDGLYLRLDMLQAFAKASIATKKNTKTGRPGPKNDSAAWFVAIVAHHWQANMPNTEITPSGAFRRICMELARLEGLPVKVTRPAIESALVKRDGVVKSKLLALGNAGM